MFLSALSFFFVYVLFFSAATFKLFLLTVGFIFFIFCTTLLLTTNALTAIFSHHTLVYKFDFLNLTYSLLLDGITLYFILLTLLLLIVCTLLA